MTDDDLAIFLRIVPPDQRTWQTFDDVHLANGVPRRNRRLARVLHGSLAAIEPVLRRLNTPEVGAGVYISGNHTDGRGRRTGNITRIATVVADLDHGLPSNLPVTPTLTVETSPNKFQVWWTLADENAVSQTEHRDIHARLVAEHGADPRASGIARVYRVPGFWHLKHEPFFVRIVDGSLRAIDRSALLAAFPPLPRHTSALSPPRRVFVPGHDFYAAGLDRLIAPLRAIPADDYATWITVGLVLHVETRGGSDGLSMWDAWSASSAKYVPGQCTARWATFQPSSTNIATGGKIFWLAALHGWRASSHMP
jgi:hypothetical protein